MGTWLSRENSVFLSGKTLLFQGILGNWWILQENVSYSAVLDGCFPTIYIYIYMYIFAVFWGICCHLKPDNKDTHMAWLERESLFPLGHLFLSHLSFTASPYVTNFEYTSKTFKTVSFQLWYKVCMSLYWGLFTWLKHTYTNVLGASCHQYYDITVLHF